MGDIKEPVNILVSDFAERVLAWYNQYGRKNLPWQKNNDSYLIWVSEVMLQQTQVTTVIPYFIRFIKTFPTIAALANADDDELMQHWAGLGYYARARNLQKAAKQIMTNYAGQFPKDFDSVVSLAGIGPSTAGAILSLAFNQQHAILDGNVKRVLCRHQLILGHPSESKTSKQLWVIAKAFTPSADNAAYTQAMMDLGAMVCTQKSPRCEACPVHRDCQALATNRVLEFPHKKAKKINKPIRHFIMPILWDEKPQQLYLEKRSQQGVWGGLWSLPLLESATELMALKHEMVQQIDGETSLPVFSHEFTHYKLRIKPVLIQCKLAKKGESLSNLAFLGLPAAVKKLLQRADIGLL